MSSRGERSLVPTRSDRRRSVLIAALVALLALTLAAWWYVAGTSSGQSCKMPATPICTDQPHKVGIEDWALAGITVGLTVGLGWSVIRDRRS